MSGTVYGTYVTSVIGVVEAFTTYNRLVQLIEETGLKAEIYSDAKVNIMVTNAEGEHAIVDMDDELIDCGFPCKENTAAKDRAHESVTGVKRVCFWGYIGLLGTITKAISQLNVEACESCDHYDMYP